MSTQLYPVDCPDAPPLVLSDRIRHEIAYFMSVPGEANVPVMPAGEYWIDAGQRDDWLESGVLSIISPLDSEHPAEIELSEEHERLLEWLRRHGIQRVRIE